MDDEEKEIRRILQAVATAGTYGYGHIKWIQNITHSKVAVLQEELKRLLNIQDCTHDY